MKTSSTCRILESLFSHVVKLSTELELSRELPLDCLVVTSPITPERLWIPRPLPRRPELSEQSESENTCPALNESRLFSCILDNILV